MSCKKLTGMNQLVRIPMACSKRKASL